MPTDLGATVLSLVIYVLAAMRITRLLNFDAVLDTPRAGVVRAFKGSPAVVYFVTCPWCVSIWVYAATAWLPIWHAWNAWYLYPALVLAGSMVAGLLSPLSADSDLTDEDDDDAQ